MASPVRRRRSAAERDRPRAVPLIQCGEMANAVHTANSRAREGDTVLLAPACASFDQFRSFEHRGDVFKQMVRGLEGGSHGAAAQD